MSCHQALSSVVPFYDKNNGSCLPSLHSATKRFQAGYIWSLYMWAVKFKASSIASPLVLKLNTHIPPLLTSRERNLNILINVLMSAAILDKASNGCFNSCYTCKRFWNFNQAIQKEVGTFKHSINYVCESSM